VSRADVRTKLDAALADAGGRIAASLITGTPPEPTDEAEAKRNDPANEEGANALLALAGGGGRP